ncbi:MAG: hypothetical protein ACO3F2_12300 [Roseiflexaceae bacterium]
MVEHNTQSLQRLYMVQAIDLFQEAYAPYVLDTLRAHFGDQLHAHLRSLVKRNKSPIFVDFVDDQPRPDFLALIHLMTHDGGLREHHNGYRPVIFAPHGSHSADGPPVAVPSFKELRLIRLRRNALNHQGTLTGEMMIDSIERIVRMVHMLPDAYQSLERRLRVQLILAQSQSSEFERQLTVMRLQQQADAHEQIHQAIISAQHMQFTQHATQIQQVEQLLQTQSNEMHQTHVVVDEIQTKLNQLLHEQQMIVRGTAEAVVDVRQQIEPRIEQLQQALSLLQVPTTIDRLQHELAAQQQITADMRIELNRLHEQVDTIQSAPLSRQFRIPWLWIIVVGVMMLFGWLWYSGWLMWGIALLQPYLNSMWPFPSN